MLVSLFDYWGLTAVTAATGSEASAAMARAAADSRPFDALLVRPSADLDSWQSLVAEAGRFSIGRVVLLRNPQAGAASSNDGIDERTARITYPVQPSELLEALAPSQGHAAHEASRRARRLRPNSAPFRILLAEDNAVNQLLAVRLLQREGHTVEVAATGKVAVDLWRRTRFDVILMDVQMPELDGFEATAAIRAGEREAGTRTPIIALTAHALASDRERCIAADMDGYVSKPITAAALVAEIERVTTANAAVPPMAGVR